MKKMMMQLIVTGLVLACATAVFAASQTSVLWAFQVEGVPNVDRPENAAHANGRGWVTFKSTRGGGTDVTVQLWDAAPKYTYIVRANGVEYGRFTTAKNGNGAFTFRVANVSVLGDSVNIWARFEHVPPTGPLDMTGLMWCATTPAQ